MPAKDVSESKSKPTRRPPARTPEARENELISSAMDLAEKQLKDGTASAQVITQFLKLGSSRERLEQERLESDIALAEAKREMMKSAARVEELFDEAITAMRQYSGQTVPQGSEDYED